MTLLATRSNWLIFFVALRTSYRFRQWHTSPLQIFLGSGHIVSVTSKLHRALKQVSHLYSEMNPTAAGMWNNPPPPGIDEEQEDRSPKHENEPKPITRIDPFLKNPEYVEYEIRMSRERHTHRKRSHSRSRHRSKSKSRSKDHDRKRRYKSRSRSRRRHRRSRSRSRARHRHSRTRSPSHERTSRHKHKDRRRRRSSSRNRRFSRSSSRSRSRSHNRKHYYAKSSRKSRTYSRSPSSEEKNEYTDNDTLKEEDKADDDQEQANKNAFKNDGSFFELYKKMQEEQQKAEAAKAEASGTSELKKPVFGKRRGGRVLKTGVVVKTKNTDEMEGVEPQDPWSIYLKEVKRYKEACCDDDSKTRPLVK